MNCLKDIINDYNESVSCITSKEMEFWLQNRSKIDAVFDMLSDAESRYVYGQEIQFCILSTFMPTDIAAAIAGNMKKELFIDYVNKAEDVKKFADIACPETFRAEDTKHQCCAATFFLEQYRYKNFVKINDGDICIDAGACLGDTAMYFADQGAKHVYSFEPDRDNIAFMQETVKKFKLEDKITIINKALANADGETFYTPNPDNIGSGTISAQKHETSYLVNMMTIDSFCKTNGIKPTFIKMDIEGAEPEAIYGAQETIVQCRPKCAICIYHAWEHRWTIPLLFRDMVEDYNFYIKKSQPYAGTVIFAEPK